MRNHLPTPTVTAALVDHSNSATRTYRVGDADISTVAVDVSDIPDAEAPVHTTVGVAVHRVASVNARALSSGTIAVSGTTAWKKTDEVTEATEACLYMDRERAVALRDALNAALGEEA